MNTFSKQNFPMLFAALIIVIAVAGGAIFYFQNKESTPPTDNGENGGESIDTSGWSEYVNEQYGFAIKYPSDWEVAALPDDELAPKFNFYKPTSADAEPPFDHFSEVTNVSIFPHGIPTEGVVSQEADIEITTQEQTKRARTYVLSDGTPWAHYLQFTQAPSSWNSSGFLWSKLKKQNFTTECFRDEEPVGSQECDPMFGDNIIHKGTVDETDYQTQLKMIETFRILEHSSGNASGKINLFSPKPGDTVKSPLTIAGEARGSWYFEATFPIVITDWDGRIIGEGYAEAQDDWMTEDFVPFLAEVSFTLPDGVPNKNGTLILQKANPSGLPENDAAIEIPISFE